MSFISSLHSIIGSKTRYGYSWNRLVISDPSLYLAPAAATVTAHQWGNFSSSDDPKEWARAVSYEVVDLTDLKFEEIENRGRCLFDKATTLKIMLFRKDKELLICFGAKNSFETECPIEEHSQFNRRQWSQILGNLLGVVPSLYPLAERVTKQIQSLNQFSDYDIKVIGHSFGGSIAQYVSLQNKIQAIVINSAPLGGGLQNHIGNARLLEASSLIHHLSIDGDYLSNTHALSLIDKIVSFLEIKTPGSFGIRETIPSAFPSSQRYAHHAYIMGSIGIAYGIGNPTSGAEFASKLKRMLNIRSIESCGQCQQST